MIDINKIRIEHLDYADRFQREVLTIYTDVVLSKRYPILNSLSITLYGYIMNVFSRIDLLSSYWQGTGSNRDQTPRMIGFMDKYFLTEHEANSLAIQLWRHKLMHTSQPRLLIDEKKDHTYRWLLHWGQELPKEQHFTLSKNDNSTKLNLAIVYLVDDLQNSISRYLQDLQISSELQNKYTKHQSALETYHYKSY